MSRQKNIVYIFCDELRQDALNCYGNPVTEMKTPNFDRIAERGTLFRNCFCNSPVCVPSRASVLTGLYPEETAVYDNEASYSGFIMPRQVTTFPEVLHENGYATANFGKTHIPKDIKPFEIDNTEGSEMTLGLSQEERQGLKKVSPKGPFGFNAASLYPDKPYKPESVTSNALEWMSTQDSPFFVRISYLQPHTPIIVKRGYEKVYKDAPFDGKLPDISNLSEFEKAFAKSVGIDTLTEEELRKSKIYYYGLVSWIDDEVGKILSFLEKKDLLKDTILIVNADHGALRGECQGLGKHIFNRASQAVPLIISDPDSPVRKEDTTLCSNIDLAATIFGMLGIDKPGQFHGRNLLSGKTPDPEDLYVYATIGYGDSNSYAFPNRAHGLLPDGRHWPRRSCIRTDRYRLDMNIRINGNYCTTDEEDVFFVDYTKCPYEDTNMVSLPEYSDTVALLYNKLHAHTKNSMEVPEDFLIQDAVTKNHRVVQ